VSLEGLKVKNPGIGVKVNAGFCRQSGVFLTENRVVNGCGSIPTLKVIFEGGYPKSKARD
jgi:hypothetical protein